MTLVIINHLKSWFPFLNTSSPSSSDMDALIQKKGGSFMRRIFLFVILMCLFVVSVIEAAQGTFQHPGGGKLLFYHISLHERAMQVRIDCPAVSSEASIFEISDNWAGVSNFSDNLYLVEALSDSREPLNICRPSSNQWKVFHHGHPFSLCYVVKSPKTSFVGSEKGDVFRPTLLKDLVFAWGYSYLLKPKDDLLRRSPIQFQVEENGFGNAYASFLKGKIFADELWDTLLIAGNFRHCSIPIRGIPFEFFLYGKNWASSNKDLVSFDKDFVSLFRKIMKRQAKNMGFYPADKMMVVLTEGSQESSGGTVVKNAIAVYPPPINGPIEKNIPLLRLVAHEHFHVWNGDNILCPEGSHKEGYYAWFHEGFTEYIAYLTLLQEGFMDDESFVQWLNATILKYYANPYSLTATVDDLAVKYWENDNYNLLPYEKGALIAFIFDKAIQHFSKKKKDLADYFLKLIEQEKVTRNGYTAEMLKKTFLDLTDVSLEPFFRDCVLGAKELPFEELAKKFSIEYQKKNVPVFELGFEMDKPVLVEGAKFIRVIPGSAAEKAGVKVGDVLVGYSVYYSEPTKEASIDILREGVKQTIRFFPAKEMCVFQMTGKSR